MSRADWEIVIGLEIHAQLATRTKMFCGCEVRYGAPANSLVCPICLGLPGTLPVVNEAAVALAVRAAFALRCRVRGGSRFARKNYFYPDLPKGYQISQHEEPLATGGELEIELADGTARRIGITRAHLEEDAGKSEHTSSCTLIDFNRCGVPLLEIVSEPEIRSPAEARIFMATLRDLLRANGVCEGDLEKGSLRCDANLSVRPRGEAALRARTEIKNLNSYRFLEKALEYEAARQIAVYEQGGTVRPESRSFDAATGMTETMRLKEEAEDYRYFPEPDLPWLVLDDDMMLRVGSALAERPLAARRRLVADYQLRPADAEVLTSERELTVFFEAVVAAGAEPRAAANWTLGETLRRAKETEGGLAALKIGPEALARLIAMVDAGRLSVSAAKQVFDEVLRTGEPPETAAARLDLAQLSDDAALADLAGRVVAAHPDLAAQYRAGRRGLLGFFMKEAMQAAGGKADPKALSRLLQELLL